MLPPALLMFGPDGSSRTPALYVVNSRELHGMLPRSTRDKAGGRRTRHCSEWRGEGREGRGEKWMVRVKEERKVCHSRRAKGNNATILNPRSCSPAADTKCSLSTNVDQ